MIDERELMKGIASLKKAGKLPSMERFLKAVAEVRKEYQHQIIEAREQSPMPEDETNR